MTTQSGLDRLTQSREVSQSAEDAAALQKISAIAQAARERGFEEGRAAQQESYRDLGTLEGQVMVHAMAHRLQQIKLSTLAGHCWKCSAPVDPRTPYHTCSSCQES